MSAGLVVSFFYQINQDLTENNFCLLMVSPAFEVPQEAASFEVFKGRRGFLSVCLCLCVCTHMCTHVCVHVRMKKRQ